MSMACPARERTYLMTAEEQANFDPYLFTQHLKDAGFEFDSEMCPVQIKKPWDRVDLGNGDFLYRQWLFEELGTANLMPTNECVHSWVESDDTDDRHRHGEGRVYCEYCGTDGET
jgi:hypothetical protein